MLWLFLLTFFLVPFVWTPMIHYSRRNQRARLWSSATCLVTMVLLILAMWATNVIVSPGAGFLVIMSMTLGMAVGLFVSQN